MDEPAYSFCNPLKTKFFFRSFVPGQAKTLVLATRETNKTSNSFITRDPWVEVARDGDKYLEEKMSESITAMQAKTVPTVIFLGIYLGHPTMPK